MKSYTVSFGDGACLYVNSPLGILFDFDEGATFYRVSTDGCSVYLAGAWHSLSDTPEHVTAAHESAKQRHAQGEGVVTESKTEELLKRIAAQVPSMLTAEGLSKVRVIVEGLDS